MMSAMLNNPQTHKIALDEYSPADQNVTLAFNGTFILKRWNGSDVQGVMYNKKRIYNDDEVILTVPSGNNSFIFDVYIVDDGLTSYTSYRVPNVELQYLFETGKKYQVKAVSKSLGSRKGQEFLMRIYDVTKRSAVQLDEWKVGENK
jgi:hypothetical protein